MAENVIGYKGVFFDCNPQSLVVRQEKQYQKEELTNGKFLIQETGVHPVRVEGDGMLFGSERFEKLQKLYALFAQKESGVLILPKMQPFAAHFAVFETSESPTLPIIRYRFIFEEEPQPKNRSMKGSDREYYVIEAGDTLPLLAAKLGYTAEELKTRYPILGEPHLTEGMVLWLN